MLHAPPSAHRTPSSLVRALTRLDSPAVDPKADPARPDLASALAAWLSWSDAMALSTVLSAAPAHVPAPPQALAGWQAQARADLQRLRQDLQARIGALVAQALRTEDDGSAWVAPHRQWQQQLQSRLPALRQRLRAALAAQSAPGARLAAIDAVMEQVLAPHEQSRLAELPTRLARHLQPGRRQDLTPDELAASLHAVLQAELDTRLLPCEALLQALQSAPEIP